MFSLNKPIEFIRILAQLPEVDMLCLVRNMQQAITIRVVEFGDDDEVHTDENVIVYVRHGLFQFLCHQVLTIL